MLRKRIMMVLRVLIDLPARRHNRAGPGAVTSAVAVAKLPAFVLEYLERYSERISFIACCQARSVMSGLRFNA